MADHPSYPSVTTFQMCHDRLVCCRRTRRVLLIYPAGRSFLRCRLCLTCRCWQQSLSSLGSFSLTESVEKILTTSRRGKLVKIQKSSLNQAVGAQTNDGDAAKLHMREQTLLSVLFMICFFQGKIQPKKHLITVLKKKILVTHFPFFGGHISFIPMDTKSHF